MKKVSKKRLVVLVIIVLVLAGAGIFWAHKHARRNAYRKPLITKEKSQNKSSEAASNSSQGEGGAIDKNGASVSSSPKPVTSSSGVITLQQPATGAKFTSGDTLGGTAKVDIVQFRLIDNQVGVIAQGSLKVVGGKFSGSVQFQARATTGRLDVFSLDPAAGSEINEVQIPVNF